MTSQELIAAISDIQEFDAHLRPQLQHVLDELQRGRIEIAERQWYEALASIPDWDDEAWERSEQITSAFQTFRVDARKLADHGQSWVGKSLPWGLLLLSLICFAMVGSAFLQAARPAVIMLLLALGIMCLFLSWCVNRYSVADREKMGGKLIDAVLNKVLESLFR